MIYFITGNKNKLEEVRAILPEAEQLDIDLPEIQGIDAKEILKAKLLEAQKRKEGPLMVEDTSLYMEALQGLPGPLVKWFLKTVGNNGLSEIAQKLGNDRAEAKTIVGYAQGAGQMHFFEGAIKGRIVSPRGDNAFGWDPIFMPEGYDKTFAEMSKEEKNKISMRRLALNQLKEFLEAKN